MSLLSALATVLFLAAPLIIPIPVRVMVVLLMVLVLGVVFVGRAQRLRPLLIVPVANTGALLPDAWAYFPRRTVSPVPSSEGGRACFGGFDGVFMDWWRWRRWGVPAPSLSYLLLNVSRIYNNLKKHTWARDASQAPPCCRSSLFSPCVCSPACHVVPLCFAVVEVRDASRACYLYWQWCWCHVIFDVRSKL